MLGLENWEAIGLSVKVAVFSVLVSLPVAVPLAYGLARWHGRFKWLVETGVNLPLALPPVVTGYLLLVLLGRQSALGGWLEAVGLRLVFTWLGAVVAAAVISFPLMVRAIRLAFQGVDPRLEGAARSLGAGRARTFFSISLPLAARGVTAAAVLGFARSLGEFGATIMVAGNIPGQTQTIPSAIFSLVQSPDGIGRSAPLVMVSVGLASVSLAASELLDRRARGRDAA